jgi:tRNA(Ile)-lysidine synthetase-like protein
MATTNDSNSLNNQTDNLPTEEIINFWFPNSHIDSTTMFDFWFDKTPDEYIRSNYKIWVDNLAKSDIDTDAFINQLSKTDLDKLALLIIGDQFTRNIYRDPSNPMYKANDKWTLKLALSMLDDSIDFKLNLNMRYFILLVLRHQRTTPLLNLVISRIKQYIKSFTDLKTEVPQSLIKFYAHSVKSYTDLTDSICCLDFYSETEFKVSINQNLILMNTDILDPNVYVHLEKISNFNKVSNFNEFDPGFVSESKQTDPIYLKLEEWLKEESVCSKSRNSIQPINVGISLSGGVDSMVMLSCFVKLKQNHPDIVGKIVAVHIEHSNRSEAVIERRFLAKFCEGLGVRFYWRTIDYMSRDTEYLDRSIYETESKKVRFGLYKYVVDKYDLVGICMGHHMGDITENVFTNIIKGKIGPDLGVMKKSDNMLDVNIHRPLLDLIKDQIFEYAHNNGIPYFKNSTPPWSCRGVIRDQMIPILKAQFGDFEPNIIKTMIMWNKMYEINYKYITKPFIDSVIKFKHGIKIRYNVDMTDDIFWDPILIEYLHSNSTHMISTKSKNIFIQWLKTVKTNSKNQCDLNSKFFAYFDAKSDFVYIINYEDICQMQNISLYSNLDDLLNEQNQNYVELDDYTKITKITKTTKTTKKKKNNLPQKIKKLFR